MVKGLCLDSLKRVSDLSLHFSHAAFPVPLYACPRIFVLMVPLMAAAPLLLIVNYTTCYSPKEIIVQRAGCLQSSLQASREGRSAAHIRCLRQNLDGERTLNGRSLIQRWPPSDSNGEEKQTRIYLKTSRVITLNLALSLYSNNISGEIPCVLCWLPAPATL